MEIDLKQPILKKNDTLAERNRALFAEKKVYVLNILASPGRQDVHDSRNHRSASR